MFARLHSRYSNSLQKPLPNRDAREQSETTHNSSELGLIRAINTIVGLPIKNTARDKIEASAAVTNSVGQINIEFYS